MWRGGEGWQRAGDSGERRLSPRTNCFFKQLVRVHIIRVKLNSLIQVRDSVVVIFFIVMHTTTINVVKSAIRFQVYGFIILCNSDVVLFFVVIRITSIIVISGFVGVKSYSFSEINNGAVILYCTSVLVYTILF